MKKIAILFVVFFCSVSLWAQTIEDDATWKLKTDTVRALKHYKAGLPVCTSA
jgi:OmpA-OmpF porin, OOP family